MKFRRVTIALAASILGLFGIWLWLFSGLPALESLPARLNTPSIRIEDRNGRLLYESLDVDGGRHAVVPLDMIPLPCRQATIATEDRRFYQHSGVDIGGIVRAVWINLRDGRIAAGGSTITQQVARNLLLEAGERGTRSLKRKLREAWLAWRLTRRFEKDEILAIYLNQTYYGGMAYGIQAAAQTFFGRPASELDTAECALLAGLPQLPAVYNPFTDPEAARRRQAVVLGLMEHDGYLTPEARRLAEREPLVFTETPYPIEAPHFSMMARAELDRLFSQEDLLRYGGLIVRTTLDLDWQRAAESAVHHHLDELQRSADGLGHNVNNAALVALDPQTGDVLALVGSPNYFDADHGGAINMAIAARQPGSALKPLVYAAALDPRAPGGGWTAATVLMDVRTSFLTDRGAAYSPENYDLQEHGPIRVREALASSLNIPAVLALEHVGLKNFFSFAQKLGITTFGDPQQYDLSLSLGGGEVRLLELTAAYAALANTGYRVSPRLLLEVTDPAGSSLYTAPTIERQRVVDERIAWLISDILSDNNARRLGFGPNSVLRIDRPAAVKTGTTSNFHDNWSVGYTPELVVGVWSGNTSYQSMRGVDGLSGAAPIWHQFMRVALSGRAAREFERPAGLTRVEICALSGLLPSEACPYRRSEWFIDGTQPTRPDDYYRKVFVDGATGLLAGPTTPVERREEKIVIDLPVEALPWARRNRLPLLTDLAAGGGEIAAFSPQPLDGESAPDLTPQPGEAIVRLVSPAPGSRFRLTTRLTREAQRILVEAVGQVDIKQMNLWIDDVLVAEIDQAPYRVWWPLSPGEHHLWAEAMLLDGTPRRSDPITIFVSAE